MIFHFMPYSTAFDYCSEINKYIAIVPNDDDWIVLWDGDTCRTISDWGHTIEQALQINSDFDVLSCTTNRIGGGDGNPQKIRNEISYEANMIKLHKLCLYQQNKFGLSAIEVFKPMSGFMLAFRKSLTKEIPFISDNIKRGGILDWDTNWLDRCLASGKRLGIIKGVAVYHHYRLHKKRKDESHLKLSLENDTINS